MPRIVVRRFAFDIELLALARHYGFKIIEAPVNLDLKYSTALKLVGGNAIWKILVDTLAIFYRLKIMRFYDLPEAERGRLIREYRTTPWDRALSVVSRLLGVGSNNEES